MPKILATVDRLMHHAHVCQTSGDSIRLTQAIAREGSDPPGQPLSGTSDGHHRADLVAISGQNL
jgi:hypothetical protein